MRFLVCPGPDLSRPRWLPASRLERVNSRNIQLILISLITLLTVFRLIRITADIFEGQRTPDEVVPGEVDPSPTRR